ncbi:HEAT repeat protein [Arthrobacter sp. CAN_A214]|uniref:HEAT repeat domain-containing protein n=1 Tax=Arthrobacter sp. CAN_A214 TaxID=2787720 RepID=UPI0018CB7B0B
MNKAIEAVADATRSVDDVGRARLAQLPAYVGLAERSARWCTSARWSRRLKGVRLLAILGAGHNTVPPLLDDPRSEVRSAAAAWASNHPSEQVVTKLILMLSDESLACRLAAQNTLIRLGRYAVPAIISHLTEAVPAALATVLLVASRVHDSALTGPALRHRNHSDPAVRSAVAQVIASAGGTAGVQELEKYLTDPADKVRATAAAGLGALGHWPSSPLLADRLGDRSWEARRAAALALDQLGSPGQLYLQRALLSTDRFAQDMAQQVLNRARSVQSKPALPTSRSSTITGRITE